MSNQPTVVAQGEKVRPFSHLLHDVKVVRAAVLASKHDGPSIDEIIAHAKAEAVRKGYAEGYAVGLVEGQEVGYVQGGKTIHDEIYAEQHSRMEQSLSTFLGDLEERVADANRSLPAWFEESERLLADAVIRIVERVLATELNTTRQSVLNIVKEAILEVNHATHLRVRLNPLDSVVIAQQRHLLQSVAAHIRDVEIVDDPSILGGCVIESDGGEVDARIETRLEIVAQELAS